MPPPGFVGEDSERAFRDAERLWARLLAEVVYNPNFKETADCNKSNVLQEYQENWKPYADVWNTSIWFSGERADASKLNGLIGRANGFALSCLKGFDPKAQVRGSDVEVDHPIASSVDVNAPGGGAARDGGFLGTGVKRSTLLLGGVALVGSAALLRWSRLL